MTMPAMSAPSARTVLSLAGTLLCGCAEWPRYSNLPESGDPDALVAGSDPGQAVTVTWSGPVAETESGTDNGLPLGAPVALGSGYGVLVEGVLAGTGWQAGAEPDREGSCGTLAFPAGDDGDYGGDVDWLAVELSTEGYLCATAEVDREGTQFDLVPYLLDACDEPGELLTDSDGLPWGFGLDTTSAGWAAPVDAGQRIGVALAAFWPQDDSLQVGWRVGLSVTTSGLCPNLPEEQ